MNHPLKILVLASLAIAALPSCGSSSSGGGAKALCADFYGKLKTCGLLDRTNYPCTNGSLPFDTCLTDCFVDAACTDIKDSICEGFSATMGTCFAACHNAYEFTCSDGSDTMPAEFVCDVNENCDDGSDEAECSKSEFFKCEDDTLIPAYYRCDDDEDCIFGEDEEGCPVYQCS